MRSLMTDQVGQRQSYGIRRNVPVFFMGHLRSHINSVPMYLVHAVRRLELDYAAREWFSGCGPAKNVLALAAASRHRRNPRLVIANPTANINGCWKFRRPIEWVSTISKMIRIAPATSERMKPCGMRLESSEAAARKLLPPTPTSRPRAGTW